MEDEQLLRYNRQIMLGDIDIAGQQKLLASRVLVVGLGGLGCPAAMYLAASGVGHLVLNDDDRVDLSNLQRQIAHTTGRVGELKTRSAAEALAALNPEIEISTRDRRLDEDELAGEVRLADVVIDATDNFTSRFLLNRFCHDARTPLVSGAAIRMEGQVTVFDSRRDDSPCYRCIYEEGTELAERCSTAGILGSVVGMIGTAQATEAVKLIVGIGEPLVGRLLVLDAWLMQWQEVRVARDPLCPVCAEPGRVGQAGG